MYEEFNLNPAGNKTCDCAIRAIASMTGAPWDYVYSFLTRLGAEMYLMPNDYRVTDRYLKDAGFVYIIIEKFGREKRSTVSELANTLGPGKYILQSYQHMTYAKDGTYYDIFDSGNRAVYAVWVTPDNPISGALKGRIQYRRDL